ncbi:MAG TPA: hypothetical protein ENJ43_02650 [Gammaproteobacteria bacterium]|nr:hypothetical protein [Gammaproteobacteria bacterium]
MRFDIPDQERAGARHPHEIFLINLIVNHILIFVSLMGMATSYPLLLLVVPVASVLILGYLLIRARRSLTSEPWFVKCHWQICARRSMFFIIMLAIMAAAIVIILLISGGDPKPQHYAFGGVAILPTMLTVLVLIIMESDAMNQARQGIVPDSMLERYPKPDGIPVLSED